MQNFEHIFIVCSSKPCGRIGPTLTGNEPATFLTAAGPYSVAVTWTKKPTTQEDLNKCLPGVKLEKIRKGRIFGASRDSCFFGGAKPRQTKTNHRKTKKIREAQKRRKKKKKLLFPYVSLVFLCFDPRCTLERKISFLSFVAWTQVQGPSPWTSLTFLNPTGSKKQQDNQNNKYHNFDKEHV